MDRLKRAVIKQELVDITGDTWEAIILNQFLYWSDRVTDFDKFIEEENQRQLKCINSTQDKILKNQPLLYGWIYKKASEIKEEIMSTDSEVTINRKITNLVSKGFLDRRNNPYLKYDRTYQYRINFSNLVMALVKHGYALEGYKIDLTIYTEPLKMLNLQNEDCNYQNENSKNQIEDLKNQIEELKAQIDGAIPETTIETTTKITPDINKIHFDEIIEYLNLKAHTQFKASSRKTQDLIKARFNEKFTLEDFKKVIDIKCAEWIGTEFEKYLQPSTLFGPKFENYVNQKDCPKVSKNEKGQTFSHYEQRPDALDAYKQLQEASQRDLASTEINKDRFANIGKKVKGGELN